MDRKTARRYVVAAQAAGLDREAGFAGVDDDLVASVVSAVLTARPNGHAAAWAALEARQAQMRALDAHGAAQVSRCAKVRPGAVDETSRGKVSVRAGRL